MLKELNPEFEPSFVHWLVIVFLTLFTLPLLIAAIAMTATYYWIGSKIVSSSRYKNLTVAVSKYKDRLFHHPLE